MAPPAMRRMNMGSLTTSSVIAKMLRFLLEGSSLYPSFFSLSAASVSKSPGNPVVSK